LLHLRLLLLYLELLHLYGMLLIHVMLRIRLIILRLLLRREMLWSLLLSRLLLLMHLLELGLGILPVWWQSLLTLALPLCHRYWLAGSVDVVRLTLCVLRYHHGPPSHHCLLLRLDSGHTQCALGSGFGISRLRRLALYLYRGIL
jgi:hypothetical protein